ncbi:MAG: leucine-rich repeat domain-containing protein [Paludibacter sp.]|nr:leucine-rich repeat domain-containing protein [Paludibacter sp.]
MRTKILLLLCLAIFTSGNLIAQTLNVVHTTEGDMATEISTELGSTPASEITTVVVTGTANLTLADCQAIKSTLTAVKTLDLSGAEFADNKTPEGSTTSATSAFGGNSNIETVILPSDLTVISARAFQAAKGLVSVTIPDGVTTIGDYAFYQCSKLALSTLPSALNSIGLWIFRECSKITFSSLPAGLIVPSAQIRTFESCTSIQSMEFPAGTTAIPNYTMQNCTALENVVFPASLTSIGANSIKGCTNLTSIRFKGATPPIVGTDALAGITLSNIIVHVPIGASDNYNVVPWSSMTIVDDVTTSIATKPVSKAISIFPNPVKDALFIDNLISDNLQFSIIDLAGKQIVNGKLSNSNSIDVSSLSKGVYFLNVSGQSLKVIKN